MKQIKILDVKLENKEVNITAIEKYKKAVINVLRQVLEIADKSLEEKDLSDLSNANIIIKFDLETSEAEVKFNGNAAAVYNLAGIVLGELNKTADNSDLLDSVTITSNYLKKYNEWSKKIIEEYKDQNIRPTDIEDEKGFIDAEQNLVIEIAIKGNKHHFKIPKENWNF